MSSHKLLIHGKNIAEFSESFDLARHVSKQVDTEFARDILIQVVEVWDVVNKNTLDIWSSLLEAVGFYPYVVDRSDGLGLNAKIRMGGYKSKYLDGIYFHSQQKAINDKIEQGINLAVSAPTSFGKSLLIEEVVASDRFDNILIIQPTLALIDETRLKLIKYSQRYNIVTNTSQEIKNRNIFILTAERVLELEGVPNIDFFVVDEFYKVAKKFEDERRDALNVAVYRTNVDFRPQMLLLAPSIDSLSDEFRSKYKVEFLKTDYSLVRNDIEEVRFSDEEEKKAKLFEFLSRATEPSLVYVSSPKRAYKLAFEYLDFLDSVADNVGIAQALMLPVFEWIDKNISPEWGLKNILLHKIGIHNGQLPRHLITKQLKFFESGAINVMFITTSLIEGVNTAAKNMFIFDLKKGSKKINFFDYSNIKGRAGRLNQYFTGNIYVFGTPPDKASFPIDVPFIEQSDASDVVIVNLERSEVKNERISDFDAMTQDVPGDLLDIIKKNAVSVDGQKAMYHYIVEHREELEGLLLWSNLPTLNQLQEALYLGFHFLYNYNSRSYTDTLALLSMKFVTSSTMKAFFDNQIRYWRVRNNQKDINDIVAESLKFIRTDAGYKIPKVLSVVQSIQQYIYKDLEFQGDYALFAAKLEGGGVDARMRIFIDFGMPQSLLIKLSNAVPDEIIKENEIIEYIRINREIVMRNLIEYERQLLIELIVQWNTRS